MRIAIYTRKSVAVENSESIETQIQLCKKYFQGENEFEIFEDEGFSGGNTNRPSFKRLMSLIKLGKFDIVAIYKVDRISRNIVDFFKIYEELEKYNVKLISISEGFDPSTPGGKMMMIMLSAFADMERENIRQRVKDNMISLAKKGCFTGGFVPFGCTIEKKEGKSFLKIEDDKIIKLMFDKYLELGSLYATQKYLLDNGIKTLTTRSSLGKILRNPVYCKSDERVSDYLLNKGFEVVGKANKKGYMTYGKTSNYPTLIVSKHNAPIDAELFLKVNLLLDKNKDKATKRESKTYWLTEILYCPFCGSKYVLVNSGKNTYYVCSSRINRASNEMGINKDKVKCENNKYVNAETIEEKVSILINNLEDDREFKKYKGNMVVDNKQNEIDILLKSIDDNKKAIDNLVEKLMLLSNAAAEPLTRKIGELTSENIELEAKIDELRINQLDAITKKNGSELQQAIREFRNIKDNKEKRNKVRIILNKLIYNPFDDSIDIEFT